MRITDDQMASRKTFRITFRENIVQKSLSRTVHCDSLIIAVQSRNRHKQRTRQVIMTKRHWFRQTHTPPNTCSFFPVIAFHFSFIVPHIHETDACECDHETNQEVSFFCHTRREKSKTFWNEICGKRCHGVRTSNKRNGDGSQY